MHYTVWFKLKTATKECSTLKDSQLRGGSKEGDGDWGYSPHPWATFSIFIFIFGKKHDRGPLKISGRNLSFSKSILQIFGGGRAPIDGPPIRNSPSQSDFLDPPLSQLYSLNA